MLVALMQRIKSIILLKFKILNKIFKRKLFFKFRNFRENSYSRKQKKIILINKTCDIFAIASC